MKRRGLLLRILRASMLAVILMAIHRKAGSVSSTTVEDRDWKSLLPAVQRIFPEITRLARVESSEPTSQLLAFDDAGLVGRVLRTSPQCDAIIGFSGPTDTLILLDSTGHIIGIELLQSGDTRDHVEAVRRDEFFLSAFQGRKRDTVIEIDAVSGATLTSLAIIETVQFSLSAAESVSAAQGELAESPVSLRFPNPLDISHVRMLYPEATAVEAIPDRTMMWVVRNASGTELGRLLRSPPITDSMIGYQGPSELLIAVDSTGAVTGVTIGRSFDNEPYVSYVREDRYFRRLFNSGSIEELSRASTEGIEGVSGATMTSQSMAAGIIKTAQAWVDQEAKEHLPAPRTARKTRAELRDIRTLISVIITIIAFALGLTSLRGIRWLRLSFQIVLLSWLGMIQGELISQAMLVGWAAHGVPWQNAAGLVVLTGAALAVPVFTGRNVYCSHICPHGIVQQLIRNRLPIRLQPNRAWSRLLRMIPPILLFIIVIIAVQQLPISLVDLEPFDAWLWTVAGIASISIAIIGLTISLFIPMFYCRMGCPTGYLLDLLSQQAGPHWTHRDSIVLSIATISWLIP